MVSLQLSDWLPSGRVGSEPPSWSTAERRRRGGHAGALGGELRAQPAGLVRRGRGRDPVPLRRVHALRGARHLRLQGKLAVGPAADQREAIRRLSC